MDLVDYLNKKALREVHIRVHPSMWHKVSIEINPFVEIALREYKRKSLEWVDDLFIELSKKYSSKVPSVFTLLGKPTREAINFVREFANRNILIKLPNVTNKTSRINGLGADSVSFAGYHKKLKVIVIELYNSFFMNFKKGNDIHLKAFLLVIKETIAHEDYHDQQKAGDAYIDYINASNSDPLSEENDDYYNQQVEIDAYAAETGQELADHGISRKERSTTCKKEFRRYYDDN